ncbi:MAG: hypothetical protein WCF33_18925 [Pseudonocardiaceae bacterium]
MQLLILGATPLSALVGGLTTLFFATDKWYANVALFFVSVVISTMFSVLIVNARGVRAQRRPAGTATGRQAEVDNLPGQTEAPVEQRAEARVEALVEQRVEPPVEVARAVLSIQDLVRDSAVDAGTVSSWSPLRQPPARPQHPMTNRPSVPDLSSYVESARIVQCPHCGGFWIDIAHSSPGYTFGCHSCGKKWDWQLGKPWPATIKISRRPDTGPAGDQ